MESGGKPAAGGRSSACPGGFMLLVLVLDNHVRLDVQLRKLALVN